MSNFCKQAIATARRYLYEDGLDIEVTPSILRNHKSGDDIRNGMSLCLAPRASVQKKPREEFDLPCARSTDIPNIAGAIAKRVRQCDVQGKRRVPL